jgi:hypothetical protein
MRNSPTFDDDRRGRRQIAFGGRLVCAAAHLSSPRGGLGRIHVFDIPEFLTGKRSATG